METGCTAASNCSTENGWPTFKNIVSSKTQKSFQGLGPKRRKSCDGDRVYYTVISIRPVGPRRRCCARGPRSPPPCACGRWPASALSIVMCIYIYIYVYTSLSLYIYIYMVSVLLCSYIIVLLIHVYIYIDIYIHTYIYIYIATFTLSYS